MRGFLGVMLALAVSGCMSSPSNNFAPAAAPVGPVASAEPLVLNTGPAPGSRAVTSPGETSSVKPAALATEEPASSATATAKTVTAAPLEPSAPAATATVAPGTPAAPPAPAATTTPAAPSKDAFPNINAAPVEPAGKLLSPEERAKMIAELEALRKRQRGTLAPDGAPAKLPAKCKDKTVAATDADCQPPAD
ncbi:MAG TPA: hypothetical protein VFB16_08885 [Bauldia sp.]|nr:hypothetical protein [Bauldia sp.]